jgi:hypothetical protein
MSLTPKHHLVHPSKDFLEGSQAELAQGMKICSHQKRGGEIAGKSHGPRMDGRIVRV